MTQTTSARRLARTLALLVPLAVALAVGAACVESPRSLGESCLANQDCLSGNCAQFVCAQTPTLLSGEPSGDGSAPGKDSGVVAVDASDGAPGDSGSAGDAPDGASDGPASDGAPDGAGDSAPTDGSTDARKKG